MKAEAAKGASKTFCFAHAETMDDAANDSGKGGYGLDWPKIQPQHKQGNNVADRKNGSSNENNVVADVWMETPHRYSDPPAL